MKVKRLAQSKRLPDRWYLELETGESLKIGLDAVADFSLYEGRELSEAELGALRAGAGKFSAKERALRLLGARQMSRRELEKKLLDKGESPEDTEAALELMERIGAINDREYAGSIVRHYAAKSYGQRRIKDELMRRGVPKEYWDEALCELPEQEGDLDRLIMKRLRGESPDEREKKRLTDMLLRRGYSWREIREALGRYGESLEEYDE